MPSATAFVILALTVTVALGRPQLGRWQIDHAQAAVGGALLALLTGVVSLSETLEAARLLSAPVITIVSLMTITVIAEKAGLLRLLAYGIARAAHGSGSRLFAYLFMLGAAVGALFTNDAAILILTPLVFDLVERVQDDNWTLTTKLPFYFAVLYVGNLVGAFLISNPINLVVGSVFDVGFLEYALWMIIPALASMVVSFIGLRFFFRRALPSTYRVPASIDWSTIDRRMLAPCAAVLFVTLLGFFSEAVTGIPLWLIALAGACALTLVHVSRGHSVP